LADHGTQLNLELDVAFGPEPRGVEEAMRVEGGYDIASKRGSQPRSGDEVGETCT
jgi:hypothetical protein